MAKKPTKAVKPAKIAQTKISQFFDDDLMPRIRAAAEVAGLSMSGYVQECVRKTLPRVKPKKKAA